MKTITKVFSISLPILFSTILGIILSSVSLFGCNNKDNSIPLFQSQKPLYESSAELDFSIEDGKIYNHFFRQNKVAAHTVLTSGKSPRVVIAFPAGNSGVGLFFKKTKQAITWHGIKSIEPISEKNAQDSSLYGIQTELVSSAQKLEITQVILGSTRFIRSFEHSGQVPNFMVTNATINGNQVTWYRNRIDGNGGYKLQLTVLSGKIYQNSEKSLILQAAKGDDLKLTLTALTGDTPLTPIVKSELVKAEYINESTALNVLAFLSYEEKLLAGSWRFATYFGRDTLMSLRLLMPVLKDKAINAAFGSVIERLSENGEVAHEEDIGELAIYKSAQASAQAENQVNHHVNKQAKLTAFYDYKMVDDDYMLAPIIADYLLVYQNNKLATSQFLQTKTTKGERYGEQLIKNFSHVINTAKNYAANPIQENLIRLKNNHLVGDWRDSQQGLGGGVVPYNVNAIFVPAALKAITTLYKSGLLADYIEDDDVFYRVDKISNMWNENARAHFNVNISKPQAISLVKRYAEKLSVTENTSGMFFNNNQLSFNAVSLDKEGKPVPILNSDAGFALLFTEPSEQVLLETIKTVLNPFPAGLLSPVGLMVANPVFSPEPVQQSFTASHYHGTVVWSWQQALFAAGLSRQLERTELSFAAKTELKRAQCKLWQIIDKTQRVKNAELWSWSIQNDKYQIESFGQRSGDKTESNAAQLWSTVYLAISKPSNLNCATN